jgi:hypothetical protein
MTRAKDDADGTSAILGHARLVYRELSDALADAIGLLRSGHEDERGAKAREALLKSHYRALQQVIAIEVRLGKRNAEHGGTGAVELDLAAARDEIHRRLARLRSTGGD